MQMQNLRAQRTENRANEYVRRTAHAAEQRSTQHRTPNRQRRRR
jgi:hypothetical protein